MVYCRKTHNQYMKAEAKYIKKKISKNIHNIDIDQALQYAGEGNIRSSVASAQKWIARKHVLVKHNSKGESKGSWVKFNDL